MTYFSRFSCGLFLVVILGLAGTAASASAAGMGLTPFRPAGASVGTLPIPAGLTLEEVQEIVVVSLHARKYQIKEKGPRHAVGYLNHKGHEATMSFVINHPTAIEFYCEGYAVKRDGTRTRPETSRSWIQNLHNDVTRRMASKLATK